MCCLVRCQSLPSQRLHPMLFRFQFWLQRFTRRNFAFKVVTVALFCLTAMYPTLPRCTLLDRAEPAAVDLRGLWTSFPAPRIESVGTSCTRARTSSAVFVRRSLAPNRKMLPPSAPGHSNYKEQNGLVRKFGDLQAAAIFQPPKSTCELTALINLLLAVEKLFATCHVP